MGVVNYTVVNGEVLAENRDGARHWYVPDPLGSTVALLDNTQSQTDTFTYWPCGEERTRTGTTATPFRFVGTVGYYRDNANRGYVRRRVLKKDLGRWLTEDPLKPYFIDIDVNQYRYVLNSPLSEIDPSGLVPCWWCFGLGILAPVCLKMCGPVGKVYGKFCGPGWPPRIRGWRPQPIDQLDHCCADHDDCYDECSLNAGEQAKCQAKRLIGIYPPKCRHLDNCDDILCGCAITAYCGWNIDCLISRRLIMAYFCFNSRPQ